MNDPLSDLAKELSDKESVAVAQLEEKVSGALGVISKIVSATAVELTYNGGNGLPAGVATRETLVVGESVLVMAIGNKLWVLGPTT